MAPVAKSTLAKRKAPEPAPVTNLPSTLPIPSDDDDEEVLDQSAVVAAIETPEQLAKKAFLGTVSEACPVANHSSGSGPNLSAEGVVIGCERITVKGAKGNVPKMLLRIALYRYPSVCSTLVNPVDGFGVVLPTKRQPASPEELARNANAKGPVVLDVSGGPGRANFLSMISPSVYLEAAGADKSKDKRDSNSVELCTPGMHVAVSGICAEYGNGKNGVVLYTNAPRVVPMHDAVAAGDAAKRIVAAACIPAAMAGNALLLSMSMSGFFGLDYNDPVHQQQADTCKNRWSQLVDGCAAKLESLALAQGKDEKLAAIADSLNQQASKIRSMNVRDVAAGLNVFDVELQKDCVTPYTAAVVQRGIFPSQNEELQCPTMCGDLFDAEKRDRLPTSFCESKVVNVLHSATSNLVQVDFRLFFVFDKAAAIIATREGKNPVLRTSKAAVSVKFTKKMIGPELVGSLDSAKISLVVEEVLYYADMAIHAPVFPRAADDLQVDGHFVSSAGIDMINGIRKVGVQISQDWMDKTMLGGRGVFIHTPPSQDATLVEPATNAGPAPTISKNGYQAINQSSFDFDSLKVPAGRTREYFVVYKGCAGNVAASPGINKSVDEGESHLADLIASVRDDNDGRVFLREDCVVYALVAPLP